MGRKLNAIRRAFDGCDQRTFHEAGRTPAKDLQHTANRLQGQAAVVRQPFGKLLQAWIVGREIPFLPKPFQRCGVPGLAPTKSEKRQVGSGQRRRGNVRHNAGGFEINRLAGGPREQAQISVLGRAG